MIIMTTPEKAARVFNKYENVAAFSVGKLPADVDLGISFSKLGILPDDDTVNAVLQGQMKASKVIKKAVKSLEKPSMENSDLCMEVTQLVNILYPENRSKKLRKTIAKHGPTILVFLVPDAGEDKVQKAKIKFLKNYLTAIFGTFGITIVQEPKVLKKLFKGKKKDVVAKVAHFIKANDKVQMSAKGAKLKTMLMSFYSIELLQAAISGLAPLAGKSKIREDDIHSYLKTLVAVYTNNNLKCAANLSKKTATKVMKALRAKNRVAVEAYNAFAEIYLKSIGAEDCKLPKVKNGYKKGKNKPKMDVDKFVKFFTKKHCKNADILLNLFAHTSAWLCEVYPGQASYNKIMSASISITGGEETFSKAYVAAAKEWAKEQNATAPSK